ncbi:MAG: N-carbamoylputrescine amidase, partial [Bacteroidota bacterium]|nr:N-carbamoylputrescine amidase [Bacteroidota bacterium]
MKTGIIQQSNTANIEDNISRLQSKIRLLADEGAELVILQELHNGLYFCQTEDVAVFDQAETIPKEHFKEMRQLMKISGVRPSMHAPIIDPAGFNEKEGWSQQNMKDNERRMFENIEKAYELD